MFRFVTCLLLWQAAVGYKPGEKPHDFPDQYMTGGILHLPYAELHEPFSAWVDHKRDASRLEYYNGVSKTFQLGDKNGGTMYKVMPVTKDGTKTYNTQECFKTPGSTGAPVHAGSVLPDIKGFQFIKTETLYGTVCDKFVMESDQGQKHNYYTLWTTTEGGTYRPVLYEMKGYDSLLGSHFDHYLVQYTMFLDATPSMADLSPPDPSTCKGWAPGAGEIVYAMSPFREFTENHEQHVHEAFADFQSAHGRVYADHKEHTARHHNFKHNMRMIYSKNRANLTYRLAVNHLTDRSAEELRVMRGYRYNHGDRGSLKFPYSPRHTDDCTGCPESIDWRLRGAVTPVKDQAVCGSCWSFGTTGAVESGYFIHSNQLVRLSQQALIDCSWGQSNNGCDGGEDTNSYKWILAHGLPTEFAYGPYLGADGYCHVNQSLDHAVHIAGHVDVPSGSENATRLAMFKHGPLSVAIDASHPSFAFYANGVYYEPKCGNTVDTLDHAVLAVGYGDLDGEPYWLVKNSWSTYWGNDGYVLMSRKDNNCGVATAATYATFM